MCLCFKFRISFSCLPFLRNGSASDDSEFGCGSPGRYNTSPFHDPNNSDIGGPDGETEPHHRAANDLAKQRKRQNEMKCRDNERSTLATSTMSNYSSASSRRSECKTDDIQPLSRWEILTY